MSVRDGDSKATVVPRAARWVPAPIAKPLGRLAKRWLARSGRELVTPRMAQDADIAGSHAFTPTVASYGVHVRGLGEAAIPEICERLSALQLPDGTPAFSGVWTHEQLFNFPRTDGAPAILYAPSVGVRPSVHVRSPFVEPAPARGRGAHQRDGMVVITGPGVRRGYWLERPTLVDIAPTILWALGAGIPEGCDGRVLTDVFEPDQYDRETRVYAATAEMSADPYTEAEQQELSRRLADLGYL